MFQPETKFTRYKCSLVHSPVACHLNASFRKGFSISSVVVALLVVITETVQALPRQQWRDDYYAHHRHGCETWNSETNANQKRGKVWLSFSLTSFLSSYRRHLLSWCPTDTSFITIAYLWPWTPLTRQLRHESAIFMVFSGLPSRPRHLASSPLFVYLPRLQWLRLLQTKSTLVYDSSFQENIERSYIDIRTRDHPPGSRFPAALKDVFLPSKSPPSTSAATDKLTQWPLGTPIHSSVAIFPKPTWRLLARSLSISSWLHMELSTNMDI